jgi:hypothetical protein
VEIDTTLDLHQGSIDDDNYARAVTSSLSGSPSQDGLDFSFSPSWLILRADFDKFILQGWQGDRFRKSNLFEIFNADQVSDTIKLMNRILLSVVRFLLDEWLPTSYPNSNQFRQSLVECVEKLELSVKELFSCPEHFENALTARLLFHQTFAGSSSSITVTQHMQNDWFISIVDPEHLKTRTMQYSDSSQFDSWSFYKLMHNEEHALPGVNLPFFLSIFSLLQKLIVDNQTNTDLEMIERLHDLASALESYFAWQTSENACRIKHGIMYHSLHFWMQYAWSSMTNKYMAFLDSPHDQTVRDFDANPADRDDSLTLFLQITFHELQNTLSILFSTQDKDLASFSNSQRAVYFLRAYLKLHGVQLVPSLSTKTLEASYPSSRGRNVLHRLHSSLSSIRPTRKRKMPKLRRTFVQQHTKDCADQTFLKSKSILPPSG